MNRARLYELAGMTRPRGLEKIIVVVNPTDVSELGDIMFEATPTDLYLIAKGTVENPRDLDVAFYTLDQKEEALQDAQMRLSGRQ